MIADAKERVIEAFSPYAASDPDLRLSALVGEKKITLVLSDDNRSVSHWFGEIPLNYGVNDARWVSAVYRVLRNELRAVKL